MRRIVLFFVCTLISVTLCAQMIAGKEFNDAAKAFGEKNYTEALRFFKIAANKGNVEAMYYVGIIYYGVETLQNYTEAAKWYEMAAEKGNNKAMYYLGSMFFEGKGVSKDYDMALKWLKMSAENDNVDAAYYVGYLFYSGNGTSQNYSEAFKWYKTAAENGNVDAMFYVAYMYHNGQGVEKNYNEALVKYKKAAEGKSKEAMYNVGTMYHKGEGVEKDYEAAEKWYQMAVDNGNSIALESLKDVQAALPEIRRKKEEERQIRLAIEEKERKEANERKLAEIAKANEQKKKLAVPGKKIYWYETISYDTSGGGLGGIILNAVGAGTTSYSVIYVAIIESVIGDSAVKAIVSSGKIEDPNYGSANYIKYKSYANEEVKKVIGLTRVKEFHEFELAQ